MEKIQRSIRVSVWRRKPKKRGDFLGDFHRFHPNLVIGKGGGSSMSLVSENSTPVDEITVDVNGSFIRPHWLRPSLKDLLVPEWECRRELYRVMCRLIKTIESSVDQPDLYELTDLWNCVKELHRRYGTVKPLGELYLLLLSRYQNRSIWGHVRSGVLVQVISLEREVKYCINLAEEYGVLDAVNFRIPFKEFVYLMNKMDETLYSKKKKTLYSGNWANSITTWAKEARAIRNNFEKLEEFERSFFPHECHGMVESSSSMVWQSMMWPNCPEYYNGPMALSNLCSRGCIPAPLKEVNHCRDLEGAQVATGFVGDARTCINYDSLGYGSVPLQQMSASMGRTSNSNSSLGGDNKYSIRDCWSSMYGVMGFLWNGGTRKIPTFSFMDTRKEKHEDSDVEGGRNEQEQYFQRNALLASGAAFLTLGCTVISAVLTAGFENKSSQSKAFAKFLCISSIALGVLSMVIMILAFRCGQHGRLQLASSICYTLGLLAAAVIPAFGILAVAGL